MQCGHHGSRLRKLSLPRTPTQVPLSTLGGYPSQRASRDMAMARAGSALMGGSRRVNSPLLLNIVCGFEPINSELVKNWLLAYIQDVTWMPPQQ